MNDDAKTLAAAPEAPDQEALKKAGEAAATDAPCTFQAVKKLNPGMDPFIFFGF